MRSYLSIGLLGLLLMSAAQSSAAQTLAQEIQELLAPDAMEDDGFGRSVSLDGDTALIEVNGDDDAGLSSGAAYTFTARRLAFGRLR